MAFNAKNLSYHTQEPAFLRRLRHEHQVTSSGISRTSVTNHRTHLKQPAEDDQPTYVVECDGEIVSKADFDQMVSTADIGTQKDVDSADSNTGKRCTSGEGQALQGQKLATRHDPTKNHPTAIGGRIKKRSIKAINENGCDHHSTKASQTKIKARRSKKLKLSFQDDQ